MKEECVESWCTAVRALGQRAESERQEAEQMAEGAPIFCSIYVPYRILRNPLVNSSCRVGQVQVAHISARYSLNFVQ